MPWPRPALRAAEPVESLRAKGGVEGEAAGKRTPPPPRVAIVGGGLAGLACAVGLVDRGVAVTIYESRTRLGGRASSFTDPLTGALVDNCQHVSMSCCTNLAHFCRRVGISGLFKTVNRILFLDEQRRVSAWKAGFLPAPFHLSGAFLGSRFLSLGDKLRIAYGLTRLRFATKPQGRSFAEWLRAAGQNDRTMTRFWETVLVSALNERLDQMDVGHARKVFLDGMLRTKTGYRLEIPRVPLGELYGSRLESWLAEKGVTVRLGTGAREVVRDDEGAVCGIRLRGGEVESANFVVLATPFDRTRDMLGAELLARMPRGDRWGEIQASPITGIHVWLDRCVCPLDHAVVIGRTIQWVFNHTYIQTGEPFDGSGQYLQLVVSAAYDLLPLDKAEILRRAVEDLTALWPAMGEARVTRSWVVTEHGATFSVRPGIDANRPPTRTDVDGLFIAGDWTDTGWPATMEGAVRSGYRAAEEVTRDLGAPRRVVQPDLPQGWLSRLLLGRGPRVVSREFLVEDVVVGRGG